MLGTVGPFASVFFRERGLSQEQLGYASAIQNLIAILSPALMTWIADAKMDARRVLMLMSLIVAISLLAMRSASGLGQVMGVWTLYCIAQTAIFPLQDGLHFSQQRRAAQTNAATSPYHRLRVWGAVGYMTPGLLLYYPLKSGSGLSIALALGAVFAFLAAIQAPLLYDTRPIKQTTEALSGRLPTFAALRMLLEPQMLVFCSAIVLVYMAFSIHWTYYSVYLTERVKLGNEWVGIANNVAMCIEIPVTFLCGWFLLKLGVKRVVMLGMILMALRLALLATTTNAFVAVGTQVFHAFLILAVSIVPHTILDHRAGDHFRHSMQALFVVIIGCANAIANLTAGWFSGLGLQSLFAFGAGLCVAATVLIWAFWKGHTPSRAELEPVNPPPPDPVTSVVAEP
jgi:PPP family 3-phenylpropionic acid transporter